MYIMVPNYSDCLRISISDKMICMRVQIAEPGPLNPRLSVSLLLIFLLPACVTHRANQFKTFAEAGKGYTDAVMTFTEEVSHAAVDADSLLLVKDHGKFKESERKEFFLLRKAKLIEVNQKLKTHTPALTKGIKALKKSRKNLNKTEAIIKATSNLLTLVTKVI